MRFLSIICLVWATVAVSSVFAYRHQSSAAEHKNNNDHHYGGDYHGGHDEYGDYCEHCDDHHQQQDHNKHHKHSHHGRPDVYIPPYDPPPVIVATNTA
ncbi:predicted protein [Lichtheimia corymbifera JMRC:FSU:9682]|uniref:Uncharacterized protein n=1 Tax=Lichtheimia corymbifera JMRC:FSU:9682 TaxID=1263082 RepID=A0A068S1J3_9FUNG|nr:predicted protein [Lichtheimia corymbifera JMRC:FSU:9682]